METIETLIGRAAEIGASDIHLIKGIPAKCRLDGQLTDLDAHSLTAEDCENYARQLAGSLYDRIAQIGEVDLARTIEGRRVRVNLFRQQGAVSAALRLLSDRIPDLDHLGLPPAVARFPEYDKGLVLVTGETGSGKSTTLAAILDRINHSRCRHIVTLEDPIEYIYRPDECIINQRQVGRDTATYAEGLRAALRQDPDIILIGEMRDLTTMETALTAAETGHLVFATLHTSSAVDSIDRMVGAFPQERQQQIRMELSATLRAVLTQRLLVRSSGRGRVAACEVMIVNTAIRTLIREGKTHQMQSALLSSAREGSLSMDNCLINMAFEGSISRQTALDQAVDRDYVGRRLGG